jgi:hypothetical protein
VDEVDDDRHGDVAGVGFGVDPVDLVGVAVQQADPGPPVIGVTAGGLVEHRGDDLRRFVFHARRKPLALGHRPGPHVLASRGQDVIDRAGGGNGVEHADHLGHPLAVALLPGR